MHNIMVTTSTSPSTLYVVRILLFLVGCLGTRLAIVYVAKHADAHVNAYLGYMALIPAIGFAYLYATNSRQTGPEVFGDKIWWNYLRPFHAVTYLSFAIATLVFEWQYAWIILLIDVLIGFMNFIAYHASRQHINICSNFFC